MARPREFDPQDALQKAMQQFWVKGYHDTSIRDLVDCTGVNYYGLYGEFESKHGLFLAALDHYRDTVTAGFLRAIKQPGPLRAGIAAAFDRLFALMKTPAGDIGCLMGNTAVELASSDAEAEAKVQAHMKQIRDAFKAKLREGRDAGEIAETMDIAALAEFLTTTTYSLGFLARSGCGPAYVRRHLRTALSVLG